MLYCNPYGALYARTVGVVKWVVRMQFCVYGLSASDLRRVIYPLTCLLFTFCALIALNSLTANAAEPPHGSDSLTREPAPVRILMQKLDAGIDLERHSFYQKVMTLTRENFPPFIIYEVPPLRQEHLFEDYPGSCMYPALATAKPHTLGNETLLQSRPFVKINIRLYTRPGAPTVSNWEDFSGQSIAIPMQYMGLKEAPPAHVDTIQVGSTERRAEMLLRGRVDAFLGASPMADLILAHKGVNERLYDPSFFLAELPLAMVCRPSLQTQKLVNVLNINLKKIYDDGLMAALMKKHGFDFQEFSVPQP